MTRLLIAVGLLTLLMRAVPKQAPSSNLPAIAPRITELGTIRDTTPDFVRLPDAVALSPSGRLVAYRTAQDLRVWNSNGRTSTVLMTGWVDNFVWSPVGDAIAFSKSNDQGSEQFVWTIRLDATSGRPLGAAQRVGLSPITGNAAQFSPDGRFIAYPRRDPGGRWNSSLVIVPASGGTERTLATGFQVRSLRWSNDGSSIYFMVSADSTRLNPMLYRMPVAGGSRQLVNAAQSGVMDDGRLTFEAPAPTNQSAWLLGDPSGKPLALMTFPNAGMNRWGEWSGRYRRAGMRTVHQRGLRVTDLSTGTSRFVIDTTAEVSPPSWFPDGRRVAAIANIDGAYALVVVSVDGSGLRKIPLATRPLLYGALIGFYTAELQISPDGRHAMFLSDDRASLELVELSTGAQRTLARPAVSVSTARWASDSRSIRYIRDGGVTVPNATRSVHEVTLDGTDKLVRALPWSELPMAAVPLVDFNHVVTFGQGAVDYRLVPLDGRPPRVLLTTPAWGGQVAPDGRTLVVRVGPATARDLRPARRLTLLSLNDSDRRDIDLPFTDLLFAPMQFHPDGRHIFVAGRESRSEPVVFYSVPLDGSTPRAVARWETKESTSAFSVSPDAKYLAYTVAATPHATFLSLDYTAGVSRLTSASARR